MLKGNFREIERRMGRRAREIPQGFEEAARKTIEAARRVAVEASSGKSYNMDNPRQRKRKPYARHGANPYPLHIINVQGGAFRKGWRVSYTRRGTVTNVELVNASAPARFLTAKGTRHMAGRPIMGHILLETRPKLLRYGREELQKALRI